MAWVAVHKNGKEGIFSHKPIRDKHLNFWYDEIKDGGICYDIERSLPKGTIKKLIGRDLAWEDNPVELKADTVEKITIDIEDYRRYLSYTNYIENWAGTFINALDVVPLIQKDIIVWSVALINKLTMNNNHCSCCKHFWSKPEVGQMYCCKLKRRITAKKKPCKYFE